MFVELIFFFRPRIERCGILINIHGHNYEWKPNALLGKGKLTLGDRDDLGYPQRNLGCTRGKAVCSCVAKGELAGCLVEARGVVEKEEMKSN